MLQKKSNENIVRKNYNFKITDKKPKFSIGDKVRISLLKTNIKDNDLYIIEKIIKKVGNKYLVKWKGYYDSFNSYVNKNDIVKYV